MTSDFLTKKSISFLKLCTIIIISISFFASSSPIEHCKKGDGLSSCLLCEQGFYLKKKKLCDTCEAPCSTCVNLSQCLSCGKGFYLNGEMCEKESLSLYVIVGSIMAAILLAVVGIALYYIMVRFKKRKMIKNRNWVLKSDSGAQNSIQSSRGMIYSRFDGAGGAAYSKNDYSVGDYSVMDSRDKSQPFGGGMVPTSKKNKGVLKR